MPQVGWQEVDKPQPVTLRVHGTQLPCMQYRFRQEGVDQVVLQTLCAGGHPSAFMLDPASIVNRAGRLAMLWRAPLEQVNEELLIYLPNRGIKDSQLQVDELEEMLDQILSLNPS